MAPYVSSLHDVEILDTRILNTSVGQTGHIEVALQNNGMSPGHGQIDVINLQGSVLMSSSNLSVVEGDQSGSRMSLSIPITPTQPGWLDVRIRYTHDTPTSYERDTTNNFIIMNLGERCTLYRNRSLRSGRVCQRRHVPMYCNCLR